MQCGYRPSYLNFSVNGGERRLLRDPRPSILYLIMKKYLIWVASLALLQGLDTSSLLHAEPLETNEVSMASAPAWLKVNQVQKVVDRIQNSMEWDIRKVKVYWYADPALFLKAHGFDGTVLAFSRKSDNSIHLGPRVDLRSFDGLFGHELVHVIVYQKYKDAIPKWLEEGLANYIGRKSPVDYAWLGKQTPIAEVRNLVHPYQKSKVPAAYHYAASTALAEMIASHCDLEDLLKLSVGKNLENYLSTYCGIEDVNKSFREWVTKKSTRAN